MYEELKEEFRLIQKGYMKTVTIEKSELLKALRTNYTQHCLRYEDAMKGFRKAYVKAVGAMLADGKKGIKGLRHTR